MVFRNKALKTTAAAIAIISMVGAGTINYVHADSNLNGDSIAIEKSIVDNNYQVKNKIEFLKNGQAITSGHGYDSLRAALSEYSSIEVEDGKLYTTLEFTDSQYSMISDIVVTVDGEKYELEKRDDRKYKVELNSFDSDIKLRYKVNIPQIEGMPQMDPHDFTMNIILTNTLQNKIEFLKNGQAITSGHGYDSLRAALSKYNSIEFKDGKLYTTLEFTDNQYSMISDIVVTVDGEEYEFEKRDDRKYKIELNSLNSDIKLRYKVNIPQIEGMPQMDPHDFTMNVKLVNVQEETNEAPTIEVNNISINVGDSFDAKSIATANDKEDGDITSSIKVTSNNVDTTKAGKYSVTYEVTDSKGITTTQTITVTVIEVETIPSNKLENGKYSIENKTVYSGNSSVGEGMVRNSLEEISYIEVKDDAIYVTLEFNSETYDLMKDLEISVDGKVANLTKNGTKVTFKVESINSVIAIKAKITAMNMMEISYNVELQESTLKSIDELPTGSESDKDKTDKDETLPQTGSPLSSTMMLGTGSTMMLLSGLLGRRKRK